MLGGCFTEVPGVVRHSVTFPRVGKASHPEFKSSKKIAALAAGVCAPSIWSQFEGEAM